MSCTSRSLVKARTSASMVGVARNLVSTRVKGWEDNLLNITYVKNLSLEK
jgi:hypothetical protein